MRNGKDERAFQKESGRRYRMQFDRYKILEGSSEDLNRRANEYIIAGWGRQGEPTCTGIHTRSYTGPREGVYKQTEFAQAMFKKGTGVTERDAKKWRAMYETLKEEKGEQI